MRRAKDWLLHEPGAKDFGEAYLSSLEPMNDALESQLAGHRIFGPLMKGMTTEQRDASRKDSRERLEKAFAGDWTQYVEGLQRDGALYAAMGIGFEDWYDVITLWSRSFVPVLVDRLHHAPPRLSAALGALQAFLDAAMAILGHSYIAASEAKVRRSEEDLSATLECIRDAVIVTDPTGKITRLNPSAVAMLGVPASEALGRSVDTIVRLERDESLASDEAKLLQRGDERLPVLVSRGAITHADRTSTGDVVVMRDVRSVREHQRRLARLAALFERVAWGIAISDESGAIEVVNDAFARLYGVAGTALAGRNIASLYAPGEIERIRVLHGDEAQRTGKINLEANHVRADGTVFPVRVEAAHIPGLEGRNEWVFSVHDLGERRQVELLRQRSDALEADNRRIEEASRMKSEFLANMSHELRTPLNSILGFSDLLERGELGPLTAEQHEFVSDIHASGKHLLRLINDVLDLSKVEVGKLEFHPEPVRLTRVLSEVCSVLKGVTHARKVSIAESIDLGADELYLDPSRLKQVLYNYLSNAIKFTREGTTIEVRARPEGASAFRIEVRDHGPGIAAEDFARLFVEFEQLDGGRSKTHGGTGLGLALTKRLVEAQGGTVGVQSTLGEGSVFHVTLPLRATRRGSMPRPRSIAGASPNAPRILVVEDDAHDQERLVSALVGAGFAVDTAVTSAQALEAIRSRTFDAVTLDLLLPDASGLQVLAELRRDADTRNTPVIVVSVVTENVTGGFVVHDVIEKPLDGSTLLASLARAGISSPSSAPILIVDDDERSAKLAAATLAKAGVRVVLASDGIAALARANEERPSAVVLDLVMPVMDGFGFLERFRADPRWAGIPVVVWTVKDLSAAEMAELARRAAAVLPKDGTGTRALIDQLREHLGPALSAPHAASAS